MIAPVEFVDLDARIGDVAIVGQSVAIRRVRHAIRRFAASSQPILLIGATGTGKEVCARAIHGASSRRGPFVPADCAALPTGLLESELFGHRRGAFTGADRDWPGLVTEADHGTLFLDEVCSLPPEAQAKLLRTIETRQVRSLGRLSPRQVDARIVAAVQPGDAGSGLGALRDDLRFRLGSVVIRLPTLAERREDVPLIAEYFAAQAGVRLDPGTTGLLTAREWRGNVRELKSAVDRAIGLSEDGSVSVVHLEEAFEYGFVEHPGVPGGGNHPLSQARAGMVDLLREFSGDTGAVARQLGVNRATVYRRCRALGISIRALSRVGW